ncbi:MAG: PIN domain-containing protein [Proteobacteria bacterium]|nr:PIN domain-containing protein [Pseudomonadota bacterium]
MSVAEQFFDTNVLLYLLSNDEAKADIAEELVAKGGHISVQVLNEFASVAMRKLGMPYDEAREALATIRAVCVVNPLTEETHDLGLDLAKRYQLSVYDAMIAASALIADCKTLLSEDMQDGLLINRKLRVKNPF